MLLILLFFTFLVVAWRTSLDAQSGLQYCYEWWRSARRQPARGPAKKTPSRMKLGRVTRIIARFCLPLYLIHTALQPLFAWAFRLCKPLAAAMSLETA